MATYVLGIDGGGTKTHAAIMDAHGHVCGVGTAGPSNYDDVGPDVARTNIAAAVHQARSVAALDAQPFAAAFLGMAGVVSPADRAVLHAIARDLDLAPDQSIGVDHDCRIALAGGLSGRPGIVQIAGTGSSTYGRNAKGEDWRSGGWGELLADEGSSYWFGRQAMIAAVRSYDGRQGPTMLLERVLVRLALDDINDIMHRLYVVKLSRSDIAALAPLVIEAAHAGDATASALIERGMEHLARCIEAVAKRLGFATSTCEIALVGGLFNAGTIILQPLHAAIGTRLPNARLLPAEQPPVVGACLLALERIDIRPDAGIEALNQP
jgi:N-acetylglucosamine kinase-like BadF-type ATPase